MGGKKNLFQEILESLVERWNRYQTKVFCQDGVVLPLMKAFEVEEKEHINCTELYVSIL